LLFFKEFFSGLEFFLSLPENKNIITHSFLGAFLAAVDDFLDGAHGGINSSIQFLGGGEIVGGNFLNEFLGEVSLELGGGLTQFFIKSGLQLVFADLLIL
jgi:hypothetical protein